MTAYFIRRTLLIIPTFIGITLLVFTITRFVPGGPIQRMIAEAQQMQLEGGGGGFGGGFLAARDKQQRGRADQEFLHVISPLEVRIPIVVTAAGRKNSPRRSHQMSRFSTVSAFFSMNSRRGSTWSPISVVNTSSALTASSILTCIRRRVSGLTVVSQS